MNEVTDNIMIRFLGVLLIAAALVSCSEDPVNPPLAQQHALEIVPGTGMDDLLDPVSVDSAWVDADTLWLAVYLDPRVRAGGDRGEPIVELDENSPIAKSFFSVADKILAKFPVGVS